MKEEAHPFRGGRRSLDCFLAFRKVVELSQLLHLQAITKTYSFRRILLNFSFDEKNRRKL